MAKKRTLLYQIRLTNEVRRLISLISASLSVVFTSYCYPLLVRWFSVAWHEENYEKLSIYNESSKIDNRKQKRKLSQQPVTVKSYAPSTVHVNDWPISPAETAVKTKLRTTIYQNWLTNEVRRQIFLIWGMFLKKRELKLFTEIVQSLSEWCIKLIF